MFCQQAQRPTDAGTVVAVEAPPFADGRPVAVGWTTVHWIFRLAVAAEFIGHGAFGIITKAAWVPYFAAVGIPEWLAWRLMPAVGAVDIALGLLALVRPTRAALLYMAAWGFWTALLRPLTGEGIWEFLERAGNVGVPLAFLLWSGWPTSRRAWFPKIDTAPPAPDRVARAAWVLRLTTATLLVGHGGFGAFMREPAWIEYFGVVGIAPRTVQAQSLLVHLGWFEIALGLLVLARPAALVLAFAFAWKVATELLRPLAGEPIWEFIERGGSYAAPLALLYMVGGPRACLPSYARSRPDRPARAPAPFPTLAPGPVATPTMASMDEAPTLRPGAVALEEYRARYGGARAPMAAMPDMPMDEASTLRPGSLAAPDIGWTGSPGSLPGSDVSEIPVHPRARAYGSQSSGTTLGLRSALRLGLVAGALGLLAVVLGVASSPPSPSAVPVRTASAPQDDAPVAEVGRGDAPMTVSAPIFAPPTAATPPALPTATPLRSAAPTGAPDPGRVGLQILSLSADARVGAAFIIGGVQARPTPPGLHVWAFVKADVPDARWYSWHRGEVVTDRDTRWAIDLYLGGAPGTRHAVRIGTVDDAGHADLTTFLRDNPDQPLPSLPDGFTQEAQITVTLE